MEKLPWNAKIFNPKTITRNILVIAPSGRGKSYAMRNLDPKTTLILGLENKPLPFRDASKFKKYLTLDENSPLELFKILKHFAKDSTIETIVIDSFSEWSDHLLNHMRATEKGHAVYGKYAEYVEILFRLLKKMSDSRKLNVIITVHEDLIMNSDGEMVKSALVKGQALRGQLERHFTIVLYGVVTRDKGKNEYWFQTQSDGMMSAKSPEGMFDSLLIENDYQLVIDAMDEYWK